MIKLKSLLNNKISKKKVINEAVGSYKSVFDYDAEDPDVARYEFMEMFINYLSEYYLNKNIIVDIFNIFKHFVNDLKIDLSLLNEKICMISHKLPYNIFI